MGRVGFSCGFLLPAPFPALVLRAALRVNADTCARFFFLGAAVVRRLTHHPGRRLELMLSALSLFGWSSVIVAFHRRVSVSVVVVFQVFASLPRMGFSAAWRQNIPVPSKQARVPR